MDAAFIEAAQHHGLIGALSVNTSHPLVRAIHVRDRARSEVMESHLRKLLIELDSVGVRATPVKGPLVAQEYDLPEIRQFSDIDLLIEEHQLERTLEILGSYEHVSEIPPKRPKAAKRDVVLVDPSGIRFNIDVHWDLFSYTQLRGAASGATDAAWARAVRVDHQLGPLWQLPMSTRLGFLASHAVLDHRFRLILFRDLAEIAKHGVDWSDLAEFAARWGLRSTTYLAMFMAARLANAPIPDAFLEQVRPSSLALRYLESKIPQLDMATFDGHSPHPVNLAAVTIHDQPLERLRLVMRAPAAFPHWRRRVVGEVEPTNTPRTLIVVSTNRRRGAEVFTERLVKGLTREGWVVDAVSLRGYPDQETVDIGPLVDGQSNPGRINWEIVRALRRRVDVFRPDLVVANGGATLRYSLLATLGRKPKLMYMSIGEPAYWISSGTSRVANRLMLRRVDKVLSVSEETARQTLELEPKIADKIEVTYTGVPDALFLAPRQHTSGPLKVVVVGSLTEEKDPELALRAASQLAEAQVRFVGDGPLRADLETLASTLGLERRVEVTGFVTDVTPHLRWADVLLLTSKSEGLPGAILEAGAAGIPTVAVSVGGVAEAVVDGEGGLIVDRSVESIANGLSRLDTNRDLLVMMGKKAQEHVRAEFGMNKILSDYGRAFRGLRR